MSGIALKFALFITSLLTLTSLTARALGSMQQPNPTLRGFTDGCEGKPQPCWYGIVPGASQFSEARKWVQSWNSQEYREIESTATFDVNTRTIGSRYSAGSCYTFFHSTQPSTVVDYIEVSDCPDLKLGDLINQFGIPKKIQFRNGVWGKINEFSFILNDERVGFNPRTKLRAFNFPSTDDTTLFFNWHGFSSHWRYCQFEPENYTCPK